MMWIVLGSSSSFQRRQEQRIIDAMALSASKFMPSSREASTSASYVIYNLLSFRWLPIEARKARNACSAVESKRSSVLYTFPPQDDVFARLRSLMTSHQARKSL
jgi:hypothetical protein